MTVTSADESSKGKSLEEDRKSDDIRRWTLGVDGTVDLELLQTSTLFDALRDLFIYACETSSDVPRLQARLLRRDAVKFKLWGEDVKISEIDTSLSCHQALRDRVRYILLMIGFLLSQGTV